MGAHLKIQQKSGEWKFWGFKACRDEAEEGEERKTEKKEIIREMCRMKNRKNAEEVAQGGGETEE